MTGARVEMNCNRMEIICMEIEEGVEVQREECKFERTMKWKSNPNFQLPMPNMQYVSFPMIYPTPYQCIRMRSSGIHFHT